jgi:uncharacterized damage-inducible protein DinB
MSVADQLLETWDVHDRINGYLLDHVEPAALGAQAASKGRTVGEQLAHVHNVRLMWLQSARPDLLTGLAKVEKDQAGDQDGLRAALGASATAIRTLLADALAGDGRVKGFKPHVVAFLGYLIAHESHHRGQIALSLKQAGAPLSKKASFGLWEWGVR